MVESRGRFPFFVLLSWLMPPFVYVMRMPALANAQAKAVQSMVAHDGGGKLEGLLPPLVIGVTIVYMAIAALACAFLAYMRTERDMAWLVVPVCLSSVVLLVLTVMMMGAFMHLH